MRSKDSEPTLKHLPGETVADVAVYFGYDANPEVKKHLDELTEQLMKREEAISAALVSLLCIALLFSYSVIDHSSDFQQFTESLISLDSTDLYLLLAIVLNIIIAIGNSTSAVTAHNNSEAIKHTLLYQIDQSKKESSNPSQIVDTAIYSGEEIK